MVACFCMSQLHILFRLKLLISWEHTATLDTGWYTVIQWKMNDMSVQGCVAPCLIIWLQSSWTSQKLCSFELWCHAVCSRSQSRRPQFKFSSPYYPYKYYQAQLPNGDRGGTVVKVLCYKLEGHWFDSRWCHWNFFIDIILPITLWPWGRLSL